MARWSARRSSAARDRLHVGARRRVRAQALRDPPPGRARARRGHRVRELLLAHAGAQGDAQRAAAAALLPRPARPARQERDRGRALALLDQHVPELAARAPEPLHRAQRRVQHAARQPLLAARPRADAGQRGVRRGPGEGAPARPARRVGLRELRPRARAAGDGGPLAPARADDARAGGVGGPRRPARGADRLLRLPRAPDRAVGRPGLADVLRRQDRRREAGPQRAAARALGADRRRLGGARVRDRGAPARPRAGRAPRAAEAGRAVRGRRRDRPRDGRPRDGVACRGPRIRTRAGPRRRCVRSPTCRPPRRRSSSRRRCPPRWRGRRWATRARTSRSSSGRWRTRARSRPARWAATPRSPRCRCAARRCSPTSASCSRRSPTRRSTRCARRS